MKSFDKNKDGVVTEVKINYPCLFLRNFTFQTDMMTKAELAFTALDRDNKGYISEKDFRKLTKKLSDQELKDLMTKVSKF